MSELTDKDWSALANLKRGDKISKAAQQRLMAASYVIITVNNTLKVTGLGNDALTRRRLGLGVPKLEEEPIDEGADENLEGEEAI
jgi:hypothetical protein